MILFEYIFVLLVVIKSLCTYFIATVGADSSWRVDCRDAFWSVQFFLGRKNIHELPLPSTFPSISAYQPR